MKFLGWIFTLLVVASVGYAACYFGWLDQWLASIKI